MDRRSRRTRDSLLRAMLGLIQKKAWEDISIREICDEADIARSTFYLHFASKEELRSYGLQLLEQELRAQPTERSLDSDGKIGCLPQLLRVMADPQHKFLFKNTGGSEATALALTQVSGITSTLIEEEIRKSRRFKQTSTLSVGFIAAGIQMAVQSWHLQTEVGDIDTLLAELDEIIGRIIQELT